MGYAIQKWVIQIFDTLTDLASRIASTFYSALNLSAFEGKLNLAYSPSHFTSNIT